MEDDQQGQRIVIIREPPKKRISDEYSEFRKKMDIRRRKVSKLYPFVEKFLNSFPKLKRRTDIMKLALRIGELVQIPVDRNAKRLNEPLICWFCENWQLVSKLVLPTYVELFMQPEVVDVNPQNVENDQDIQKLDQEIQKIMQEIGDMDQFEIDVDNINLSRSESSDTSGPNPQ
ncbi:hypothetical protein TVAG_586070 [Trichomonas vaginalis G3]|uniref:Uncharacterized protein n=1 Tax=Trichomonas vaginalis (strain ATCC PRA-98 / G3) TaxID=412133 RepID=A2GCU2_TRIV3|nr:hypothetical protein TVAGG3_0793310 [Trichomonas vaginalis G3]EAX85026.1 hypothetical protein TVAG_586070 [Trichomonas vaginalis G3]KAI5495969.1 hypothetical protein TVAGG3_0793310 [Trichomonas vaginalis G3]|eukprot:XP_001297956.1 hypothetical protein [Trichomonas vaginalis G3]